MPRPFRTSFFLGIFMIVASATLGIVMLKAPLSQLAQAVVGAASFAIAVATPLAFKNELRVARLLWAQAVADADRARGQGRNRIGPMLLPGRDDPQMEEPPAPEPQAAQNNQAGEIPPLVEIAAQDPQRNPEPLAPNLHANAQVEAAAEAAPVDFEDDGIPNALNQPPIESKTPEQQTPPTSPRTAWPTSQTTAQTQTTRAEPTLVQVAPAPPQNRANVSVRLLRDDGGQNQEHQA